MRGAGGTVLEAGKAEVVRRVPGKAVPGIEEEGVLLNVHPRAPAAAGKMRAKRGGMDEGAGTSEDSAPGRAELRLCNLVAQGAGDAEGRFQARGGKGADG